MSEGTHRFGVSSKLQELICFLGQSQVFSDGSETLLKTLHLEISDRQVERISEHYGARIEEQMQQYDSQVLPQVKQKSKAEPVYVMIDGSMIYTREEGWKEIKLGRIHARGQVTENQKKRSQLHNSVYVNHLGKCDDFFVKLERMLIPYAKKIIVADGAKWIWKWAEDNYPGSVQILDFYYAVEKLLNDQVHQVIQQIIKIKCRNDNAKKSKTEIIRYYETHEDRMQYKSFSDKGYMIGSGPIESAHKSVIQQRMKLSGQRWSIQGVQAIADLRCAYSSNNHDCIKYLIKMAA